MVVVICPGVHDPQLTSSFIEELGDRLEPYWVYPTDQYPAFSAPHLFQLLNDQFSDRPALTFISFSAGVAAAMGAAWAWQATGGHIKALIAVDGWGVLLTGPFPIHRISHDYFTHWSSAFLGPGDDSFYADPAVPHLDLWRSPRSARGWQVRSAPSSWPTAPPPPPLYTTAAQFLTDLLRRYQG